MLFSLVTRRASFEVALLGDIAPSEPANTVRELQTRIHSPWGESSLSEERGGTVIEEKLEFFGPKPSPLDSSRPSRKREGEESATSKRVSDG